jgi:hypothetical protein
MTHKVACDFCRRSHAQCQVQLEKHSCDRCLSRGLRCSYYNARPPGNVNLNPEAYARRREAYLQRYQPQLEPSADLQLLRSEIEALTQVRDDLLNQVAALEQRLSEPVPIPEQSSQVLVFQSQPSSQPSTPWYARSPPPDFLLDQQ